jgi:hypothetical protein
MTFLGEYGTKSLQERRDYHVMYNPYVKLSKRIVRLNMIEWVNDEEIQDQVIRVKVRGVEEPEVVQGFFAIELVHKLKPSALEGNWKFWYKYSWIIHNIIAHPVMQILCLLGAVDLGIWVHDITVPTPKYQR